jgi:hypothetical protein
MRSRVSNSLRSCTRSASRRYFCTDNSTDGRAALITPHQPHPTTPCATGLGRERCGGVLASRPARSVRLRFFLSELHLRFDTAGADRGVLNVLGASDRERVRGTKRTYAAPAYPATLYKDITNTVHASLYLPVPCTLSDGNARFVEALRSVGSAVAGRALQSGRSGARAPKGVRFGAVPAEVRPSWAG